MNVSIKRRELNADSDIELGIDSVSPLLQRIYAARHVGNKDELDYSLSKLLPSNGLMGIQQAVVLLEETLKSQQRVLIVGDFDADGATSTALGIRGLRAFGFQYVDYLVPNRFEYGYGLTPEIVDVALEYKPDLIITVDNGISSIQGVAVAKSHGINVLVTDHHLAGKVLPEADAIINPNQPGDSFGSKNLAGVGVVFYLLMALRSHLRETGWFENNKLIEPNLAQWLDLVALGTIADVVPLDHNNRILVSQGLARIQSGQTCAGIRALTEIAGRDFHSLSSVDIGFIIGPRLNAAGRLDDMSLGIECLLCDNYNKARQLAQQLDSLNKERRYIEEGMKQQALNLLDNMQLDESDLPVGLCLFQPDWHEGVVGILASRIKERLHRPVIAFARTGDNSIKGSARSVKGVHIRNVLDAVAARHPELLQRFGGHAMAAGLTLAEADYPAFTEAFDKEVQRILPAESVEGVIETDGELEDEYLNLEFAELLRQSGPWGQAFEEPVFDGVFRLLNYRIVGEKHLKLQVQATDQLDAIDAIAFNTTDEHWSSVPEQVRLVYRLDVNEFRQRRNLQCIVQHIEPV
ncbi:MAG: single-stranded-DNA-specific exonuclease RecJ [Gammaproteobacteria bacterium]|nr:single-stranded-DNA-specific exonuclease RecJ [Gammaproteobacteria bacterium]